jgi:cyanophycin synthetase
MWFYIGIIVCILTVYILFKNNIVIENFSIKIVIDNKLATLLKKNNMALDIDNETLTRNNIVIDLSKINSSEAVSICVHKLTTSRMLNEQGIPTPTFIAYNNNMSVDTNVNIISNTLNFPMVAKPTSGYGGIAVHVDLNTAKELKNALQTIISDESYKKIIMKRRNKDDTTLMVENMVRGKNYRIIAYKDKIYSVIERQKPAVVGNGVHTLGELVDDRSKYTLKIYNHEFNKNNIDTEMILKQNVTLDSIIPKGKQIYLSNLISLNNGSLPLKIELDKIHPENIRMFSSVNSILGTQITGIDFMTEDLMVPYYVDGHIMEVNSSPGLIYQCTIDPDNVIQLFNDMFDDAQKYQ